MYYILIILLCLYITDPQASVGRNGQKKGSHILFVPKLIFFCIFGTLRVQAVPKWRGYNFHASGSPLILHKSKMAAKDLSSLISLLIKVRFE